MGDLFREFIVEQRTPSPVQPQDTSVKGTKDFAEIEYTPATKKAPRGFIRKTKLKDKGLIADQIDNQAHIRSIKYEQ